MPKKNPETSPRTAVIYARYSSHSQRDVSIDQQVKAVRQYAERNGMSVIRVYADRAMTGTNDQRPEFQRMIEDAKKHAFDAVIVYSLDRFARDRYDSVVYKRQLRDNGVRVFSATEAVSDDPAGILMESMLEGLAEYYSKELANKIKRGLMDNAERCMVTSAMPYGYRKGQDGKFEIDPKEAEIVREIYLRVVSGEPLIDICRDLNNRGVKTKRGAAWNRSSFNKMLSNERYIGTYIYSDVRVENGMPAIVDKETFWAAQAFICSKPNPRGVPGKRRRKTVYNLTGKIFCGLCHEPMVGNSGTSKSGDLHTYYACKGQLHKTCEKKRVPQNKLEQFVAQAIFECILDDELINILADNAMQHQAEAEKQESNDEALLRKELDQVESALQNILKAIERGMYMETMHDRMLELEAQKKELEAQLAYQHQTHTIERLSREEYIAAFQLLREGEIGNEAFRELIFSMFVSMIQVTDDRMKIIFKYSKSGHNAVDLPFDPDKIEEAPCSLKRKWWAFNTLKRTSYIYVFDEYIILDLPYVS